MSDVVVMKFIANITQITRTRYQLLYFTLIIASLTILFFGRKVHLAYERPFELHEFGGVVSTLLGSWSKSKEFSEQPQDGASNQDHYPIFEVGDSKQLPLPMNATNKFPLADFGPHGNDTLVMIHIQKTGGLIFLGRLVNVTRNGKYLCEKVRRKGNFQLNFCPRDPLQPNGEQWLISERTIGWICGVHASYTEFQSCFPNLSPKFISNRILHYGVFLRHPVLRYISEYLHVQSNATWLSKHICRGKLVSLLEMPPCYPSCYDNKPWPNLTTSSFISCESNWANNRQTMMLANLEAVGCFDKKYLTKENRDRIILESAKENLKSISFFGLTEYMKESYAIFEKQFGVKFPNRSIKRNLLNSHASEMLPIFFDNTTLFNAILRVNSLDMELYKFAVDMFLERATNVNVAVNKDQLELEFDVLRATVLFTKQFNKYFYNFHN